MLCIRYLSDTHLKGFERYQYNCIDGSFLSIYLLDPFWEKCIKLFPKWIAPNLLTFTGFLLTWLNFGILAYYDWDFMAANLEINPVPRWVWLLCAINFFIAYTLDGVDGKQARRIKASGPLGELFDHGVDSYATFLIPLYTFSLFGKIDLGPFHMYTLVFNVIFNFHAAHFAKYNTGIMYLPAALDISMMGIILTLVFTFFTGPEIWRNRFFYDIPPARIFEITFIMFGVLFNLPFITRNIYNSYKKRTGKMRPFMEAVRPFFPVIGLFLVTLIWAIFSHNNILFMDTRIFFLLCGITYSNMCCRLIVAQMSGTRADGWNALMWPICLVVVIFTFPYYDNIGINKLSYEIEKYTLYTMTTIAAIVHTHYTQGIVREMCAHFNIKCFKVPTTVAIIEST